MIDYWKKKIEFAVYDYPYNNENLKKYKIRDIIIEHTIDEIKITFNKKDLILAHGILICKINEIIDAEEIFIYLCTDSIKIDITTNTLKEINESLEKMKKFNSILYKALILTCNDMSFSIQTPNYDLTKEMGIICYYDLNDEYEDQILNEIMENIKDTYRSQ